MKRDRLVMITDSKAMPRPGVSVETTYPFVLDELLRARLGAACPAVAVHSRRARTTRDVLAHFRDEAELLAPHVLVLDVNTVGCAPRVFMPWEGRLVFSIPGVRGLARRLVQKHRRRLILLRRTRVYVKLPEFKRNVALITQRALEAGIPHVIWMSGIVPRPSVEHRSPGYRANTQRYNEALEALADGVRVQYFDATACLERHGAQDSLMADAVHPNEAGHELLARALADAVAPLFEARATEAARETPS